MKGEIIATLRNQYGKKMLGWAREYTTNMDDAEDIVSDALMKVSRVEIKGKPATYLYLAVKSVGIDFKRKRWPKPLSDHAENTFAVEPHTAGEVSVDQFLSQLKPIYAAVLRHKMDGTPDIEGAKIMGITEPAYKAMLDRARKKCRTLYIFSKN